MRNILIFHSAALGDFVLSWPLAIALGRLFPQSRIIYVCPSQKGMLAQKAIGVESIDVEAGWHHLFGDGQSLPEPCRRILSGARLIVSFVAADSDAWTKAARTFAPQAQFIHLTTRPPESFPSRAVDFLVEQLADYAAVGMAVRQILAWIDDRGLGLWRGGAELVIHPGSGAREKCWPAERFLELIQRLRQAGCPSRVILGEVEIERLTPEMIRRFESAAKVTRPKDAVELLSQLAHSRAYVGNDSGPTHLAGMIGAPTLAIFPSGNPAVWRPIGPRVTVLAAQASGMISPDSVLAAARDRMDGKLSG